MTNREELEAALAKAEAAREYLEAALAKAEAALVNTVTDASKIDANRAEASAKLDKARANCVRARAALREFNHSNPIVTSHERSYIQVGESEDVPKPSVIASPHLIQSREHAFRSEEKRSQDELYAPESNCTSEAAEWFGCGGAKLYRRDAFHVVCLIAEEVEGGGGCTAWRSTSGSGVPVTSRA